MDFIARFASQGIVEAEGGHFTTIAGEDRVGGLVLGSRNGPHDAVLLEVKAVTGRFDDFQIQHAIRCATERIKQAAADGMEIPTGEVSQGLAGTFIECGERLGIHEHGIFQGERARFIKDDLTQPRELFPKAERSNKDAVTFRPARGDVIGERRGHAESAGAGHDEDGDHDLHGLGPFARVLPPPNAADDAREHDDDQITAKELFESEIAIFTTTTCFEKFVQRGVFPSFEGDGIQRARSGIESTGRQQLATGTGAGIAFAIDPFEADAGVRIFELRGDGDGLTGLYGEGFTSLQSLQSIGFGNRRITHETAAIAGDGHLLHETAAEHQEDEHGHEVEVFEALLPAHPADDRAQVSRENAE